ncbi:MAG: DUF3467 domain-containing protein [Planctomycetota bacterium]|nr:DUF3467 domain-containing protein [Planctomycetota bacterium]
MADDVNTPGADSPISGPGLEGADGRKVRLRISEANRSTGYTNAFRTMATAEEVGIDLGVNAMAAATDDSQTIEVVFDVNHRLIMNYYMAKRLAIALGRIVRGYEQQFGELELDPRKRTRPGATSSGGMLDSDTP